MNRSSQQGFTLIELVAVIVLLGILAVTALPRFLDISSDAKVAVLRGLVASMQGAAQQINAKALVQNRISSAAGITVASNLGNVEVMNGYPRANNTTGGLDIEDLIDLGGTNGNAGNTPQFIATAAANNPNRVVGYDTDGDNDVDANDGCFVQYVEAGVGGTPQYNITSTDC